MRAIAAYYQSLVCKNNKAVGQEIAWLEVSSFMIFYELVQIYFGYSTL